MQILLNHDEIMDVIQDKLQGVVEDHVRSQINIADGQELSVMITNNGGLFGATIGIQGLGSTGTMKAPVKATNKRASKVALPPMVTSTFEQAPSVETHIAARVAEDQAQVDEELTGRGISDSPEDRQDPKAEAAPVALPVIKGTSIFAKAAAAAPVAEAEEEPVREAMGEAPAPEPVRKSIFAFPKSA